MTAILNIQKTEKVKELDGFAKSLKSLNLIGVKLTTRLVILKIIEKNTSITAEEIKSFYKEHFKKEIDNSMISKLFSALIKQGLIQECNIIGHYEDRRKKYFKLTEDGKKALNLLKIL